MCVKHTNLGPEYVVSMCTFTHTLANRWSGISPSRENCMEAGLLISSLPVPKTNEASVFPMPVANCPNAPALHVCESVPNKTYGPRGGGRGDWKGGGGLAEE